MPIFSVVGHSRIMLSDPLNYKSLNFEQILDAIEGIFNTTIKNLTHQLSISYRRDATGLVIEVKKPVNHVPDGYTTNGSSHLQGSQFLSRLP